MWGISLDWVDIGLGVYGLVLSLYTWYRPRTGARPAYLLYGHWVVSASPNRGIEVRFRGEEVDTIYRTILVFVNKGWDTITKDHIASTAPLKLVFAAGRVLDARVLGTTTEVVGAAVTMDGLEVGFTFDHLNRDDGFSVEVLHTEDPSKVAVRGAIRGVSGLVKLERALRFTPTVVERWVIGGLIGGALILANQWVESRLLQYVAAAYTTLYLIALLAAIGIARRASREGILASLWNASGLPEKGEF